MNLKVTLAVLLTVLTLHTAQAAAVSVELPVASYHLTSRTEPNGTAYNQHQLGTGAGIGLRTTSDGWEYGIKAGTYLNSYRVRSNYITFNPAYKLNDTVTVGLLVGPITGYGAGTKLAVAPQVEVALGASAFTTLTYLQTTRTGGSSAIALNLGWRF